MIDKVIVMEEIKVSVGCIVYNQVHYIEQTIKGFLAQKTNFTFEVLIHDDASTDGTPDVIKKYADKYPNIIKPIFQTENQYSKGVDITPVYNISRARGKYFAWCEGDDYWIDPYKLQKQVDFLDKNPEYGFAYTKALKYIQNKRKIKGVFGAEVKDFTDLLQNGNRIPTLSVCARLDLVKKYFNEINSSSRDWLMGDYPLWLWLSHNSKIKFINECTCVYRVLQESACHTFDVDKKMRFNKSYYEIREFFSLLYSVPIEKRDETKELYQVLCTLLLKQRGSCELRKQLRDVYKQLKNKNLHDRFYYILSYTYLSLFFISVIK